MNSIDSGRSIIFNNGQFIKEELPILVILLLKFTFNNERQSLKALLGIWVTSSGIVISTRLLHSVNVKFPNSFIELGNSIFTKDSQPVKTLLPIETILSGIKTLFKEVQFLNKRLGILAMVFEKVNFSKLVQSEKAEELIKLKLSAELNSLIDEQPKKAFSSITFKVFGKFNSIKLSQFSKADALIIERFSEKIIFFKLIENENILDSKISKFWGSFT